MRRSICYTEPKTALAGQTSTWKFIYSPANNLPKGTKLLFDPLSRGKNVEWQLPDVNPKAKQNVIWMELPDQKTLAAKFIEMANPLAFQYEFVLPKEIKAGENLIIYAGCPDLDKSKDLGNRTQLFSKRRRTFHLYVDTKGKGDYKEPEVFTMDVRGNQLHTIRIIAPSIVAKNERFDVIVRFEDAFGNLTGLAPEGTLIELTYEQLRENLNWKLFVPETGFISLPNLYFNEPGLYRLQLKNSGSSQAQTFYSPPIICIEEEGKSIYWGVLHGESERFDANVQVESCLRFFRDDKAMQFYGISPFEGEEEISNEYWKFIATQCHEFNEDDRFAVFLGFQWCGTSPGEGLKHLIYHKDNKPLLRKKDNKSNQIKKIYKSHTSKELQGIPSFTMAKGCHFDFSSFDPDHEHVVEIYNAWGSSECLEKQGNPRPIKMKKSSGKGYSETEEGSIRKALNDNHRFGFVAGGLDDRGIFSELFETDQIQYTPGLTAILATGHTRDALFTALQNRSCFATTGERMIVDLKIAGKPMGSEISTKTKPGLAYVRYLSGYVAGTKNITEMIIVRNGEVFKTFHPNEPYFEFALDDDEPIDKVILPSANEYPPFVYYYIRAMQEDGHMAWGSPIWVDHPAGQAAAPKKNKKPKNSKG
ncbi:MAG: DUF3604 domain-containing protein [Simkaniaceae bacterium]